MAHFFKKDKKGKTVLNAFIEIVNESYSKQINYGLIKEENFTRKNYTRMARQ